MLNKYRKVLSPIITALAKPFLKVEPNILTVVALIFPVGYVFAMAHNQYVWSLLFLTAAMFDSVDGAVARMAGKESKFGGVLDSTFDRISDSLYIAGFALAGLVAWSWVYVLVVSSFLISYIRSRAELAGFGSFKLDIGLIERAERLVGLGCCLVCAWLWPAVVIFSTPLVKLFFGVVFGLSVITIVQRLYKAFNLLR